MPDPIDTEVDRALGLLSEPATAAPAQTVEQGAALMNRAIFDEQIRQQREILALQRDAHRDMIDGMRAEQATMLALLNTLGLAELRAHVKSEFHGAEHGIETAETVREDGFIL